MGSGDPGGPIGDGGPMASSGLSGGKVAQIGGDQMSTGLGWAVSLVGADRSRACAQGMDLDGNV